MKVYISTPKGQRLKCKFKIINPLGDNVEEILRILSYINDR